MHNAEFRLLIVDDSDAMALSSQSFLTGLPLEFVTAKSVDEALNIVRTQPIDMLLLDYQLGNGNGDQVCQGLMEIFPEVGLPTVVMSADVAALTKLNETYPFVYSRLPKPFRREAIHSVFSDLVRSLRQHLREQEEIPADAAAVPAPAAELNGHALHPPAVHALAAGLGGGDRSDAFAPPDRSGMSEGGVVAGGGEGEAFDLHLRNAAEEAMAGVRDAEMEDDDHPNSGTDENDPPIRRIIAPRSVGSAIPSGNGKGTNWSLPVPPSRRRPEVPAAAPSTPAAVPPAAPTAERTVSAVATMPATAFLWRFPLHLAGGGENALRWLAEHSKVRGMITLVSLTTEHSAYHVWIDRGAIAGFSSKSVPSKYRPRDMAPDLLAVLLAEQGAGTDPVAALAGPPEAFQAYQEQIHDEVMTLSHGVVEAVQREELPAWCRKE